MGFPILNQNYGMFGNDWWQSPQIPLSPMEPPDVRIERMLKGYRPPGAMAVNPAGLPNASPKMQDMIPFYGGGSSSDISSAILENPMGSIPSPAKSGFVEGEISLKPPPPPPSKWRNAAGVTRDFLGDVFAAGSVPSTGSTPMDAMRAGRAAYESGRQRAWINEQREIAGEDRRMKREEHTQEMKTRATIAEAQKILYERQKETELRQQEYVKKQAEALRNKRNVVETTYGLIDANTGEVIAKPPEKKDEFQLRREALEFVAAQKGEKVNWKDQANLDFYFYGSKGDPKDKIHMSYWDYVTNGTPIQRQRIQETEARTAATKLRLQALRSAAQAATQAGRMTAGAFNTYTNGLNRMNTEKERLEIEARNTLEEGLMKARKDGFGTIAPEVSKRLIDQYNDVMESIDRSFRVKIDTAEGNLKRFGFAPGQQTTPAGPPAAGAPPPTPQQQGGPGLPIVHYGGKDYYFTGYDSNGDALLQPVIQQK